METETYYQYSYFKLPSRQAEKCLLVSDGMGYTAAPDFLINRKTFYNYLAFYVHNGTFHIEQYGHHFTLREGECGIMNLMDPHLYYSDSEDIAHLLWFHFRGASMEQVIQFMRGNKQLPYLVHNLKIYQNFIEAFRLTESQASETEIATHLYGTIMKILSDYSFANQEDCRIPKEMTQAIQFMDKHLYSTLSLEAIGKNAGMGKYHFCHQFKKWYGIAPMQYYNRKKMEAACTMLTESDYSVDIIAEQLGYTDAGHFRKMFKSYFGVTPSVYRKEHILR